MYPLSVLHYTIPYARISHCHFPELLVSDKITEDFIKVKGSFDFIELVNFSCAQMVYTQSIGDIQTMLLSIYIQRKFEGKVIDMTSCFLKM